jgi:hypothetical protein
MTLPTTPKKERKAADEYAQRLQAEAELKANGGKPDEAEKERVAIKELCQALHVEMKEVSVRPGRIEVDVIAHKFGVFATNFYSDCS